MTATATLTLGEISNAALVGVIRRIRGIKRTQKYGIRSDNLWESDIISSQAEMAVANHFNLYWPGGIDDLKVPDVGGMIEVRSCTRRTDRLILHPDPKDPPHLIYVLVYPDPPNFELMGWCYGSEGKLDKYWSDPCGGRPAFFVPQSDLRGIETLTISR